MHSLYLHCYRRPALLFHSMDVFDVFNRITPICAGVFHCLCTTGRLVHHKRVTFRLLLALVVFQHPFLATAADRLKRSCEIQRARTCTALFILSKKKNLGFGFGNGFIPKPRSFLHLILTYLILLKFYNMILMATYLNKRGDPIWLCLERIISIAMRNGNTGEKLSCASSILNDSSHSHPN